MPTYSTNIPNFSEWFHLDYGYDKYPWLKNILAWQQLQSQSTSIAPAAAPALMQQNPRFVIRQSYVLSCFYDLLNIFAAERIEGNDVDATCLFATHKSIHTRQCTIT